MIQIISIRDEIDLTAPGGQRRLKLILRRGSRIVELPISQEQAGVIIQVRDEVSTDPEDVSHEPTLSLASISGKAKASGRRATQPAHEDDSPIRLASVAELGTYSDDEDDL
jgi:hypothetical protein